MCELCVDRRKIDCWKKENVEMLSFSLRNNKKNCLSIESCALVIVQAVARSIMEWLLALSSINEIKYA